MIFTVYKDKLFFLDVLLHLLFSFIVLMLVFIIRFRKIRQQDLVKKVKKVLSQSDILDEISDTSALDQTTLKILDSIYENQDTSDKVTNKDIEKASYNQVIIFCLCLFVIIFFIDDKKSVAKLFLEKTITFGVLGSTIYLYSYYFREKYSEISEKQIYDMMKISNTKLKTGTTF